MKRGLFIIVLTGFVISLFVNCEKKSSQKETADFSLGDPQSKNNIILKIDNSYYFNSDFEEYVNAALGEDQKTITLESLSSLFDSFLEEKILLQAAKIQRISLTWEEKEEYLSKLLNELKSDGSKTSMEEIDTKILFDRLLIEKLTYELVKNVEVSEEEIKEYYQLHKREFLLPERVKVSQILLDTEVKAIEVFEKARNASGENFRKIAQLESVGLEAHKGGEMGVFEMGQLPYEMEKVIFSLKEEEVSPVVESPYGYHIFRLDKKYGMELISEKDAAPNIKAKILDQKIKMRVSEYLENLKKNIDWSFYPQNLSFPYQRKNP